MKKRIIAFLIPVLMLFNVCLPVYARVVDYSEGIRTYNVALSDYSYGSNISFDSDGALIMKDGSCVEYSFYLPFEAADAEIWYTVGTPVTFEYDFGEGSASKSVSANSSKISVSFQKRKSAGDSRIVIRTNGDAVLRNIIFKKIKQPVCIPQEIGTIEQDKRPLPRLNEFQDAVQTAVIINPNYPVILVNGAKRYVDYNDSSVKPEIIGNSLYLPLESFAQSLGYYYEEIPEEGYVLLRNSRFEFVQKNGKLYKQSNGIGYSEMENILINKNGTTYVPARYFSETVGKKVIYKDGFTVIENSEILAKNITDTAIFDEVKELFKCFSSSRSGVTYYVAQTENADDNNDGSSEAPFRTLAKAGEAALAGDTVIVRSGTYRETLKSKNSGTASSPIVFRAEEGADVVISALDEVTAVPEKQDNGIFVYDMGYTLGNGRNQIFIGGKVYAEGRHPNSNTSPRKWPETELCPLWPTIGNIMVSCDGKGDTAVSASDLNQPADYWEGGTLVSLHGEAWNLGTAKIKGSESGMLYLEDMTENWWFKTQHHDTDFAYITGHKNTVDMPGEWYWDDEEKLLYIIPPESEDTMKLEAKKRQVTVDFSENSYVQLVNINTLGGGMKLNHSNMCVINGGSHEYISHYTYTKDQHYAFIDDAVITNKNGAPLRGETGIFLGGSDNAILNTNIRYSAASGIYSTGLYSYIVNNNIEECGYMAAYVGGIYVVANAAEDKIDTPRGGHLIQYNTLNKSGRGVFQIAAIEDEPWFWSEGQTPFLAMDISYNMFTGGSIAARDTGTVYIHGAVLGSDRAKTKFHNNIVCNPWALDGGCSGLYWDNWVHGADCYGNIIYSSNGVKMNMGDLYIQDANHFADSYATIPAWNNKPLGEIDGGLDSVGLGDYPNSQKFRVGCEHEGKTYKDNFNAIEPEKETYQAVNAKTSSNAEKKDGFVDLKQNGEWICFENVEFGDQYNSIEMSFVGDTKYTGDGVDIIIGKSMSSDNVISKTLTMESLEANDVTKQVIALPECSGTQNVYVKATDYKSAAIGGISPIRVSEKEIENIIYAQTYMGTLSEVTQGNILVKPGPGSQLGKDLLYNTQGAATALFKNVVINRDVNTLVMNMASGGEYSNQTVQVRVGSPDSEVIAELNVESNDWEDYVTQSVPLNSVLKKGKYDIYFTFVEGGKSTNAWWYGFQNKEAQQ